MISDLYFGVAVWVTVGISFYLALIPWRVNIYADSDTSVGLGVADIAAFAFIGPMVLASILISYPLTLIIIPNTGK